MTQVKSVASFYFFRPLADPEALREEAEAACLREGLLGTVLLAGEGVNAALAGPATNIGRVLASCFPDAHVNWSTATAGNPVFDRLKVRVKGEIVTFGQPLPPAAPAGRHVDAATWNGLLDDPSVTVIDVRNDYESDIGMFRGAMRADTTTFGGFRDFARRALDPARDRHVALYCTGGIRCEKASAYLIEQGFEDISQLDGGILGYFAQAAGGDAFDGECFVFDQRVSVTDHLLQGSYALCARCGRAIRPIDRPLTPPRSSDRPMCPGCRDR